MVFVVDSILWWVLCSALVGTVFLIDLNTYLRGAGKHHIDAVLGAVVLIILLGSLIAFGWQTATAMVVVSLIIGAVL